MMKKTTFSLLILSMCMLLSLRVNAEETEITDAQYTDKFEKVSDYAQFSEDNESLLENPIWIEGIAKSYDDNAKTIIIKTVEGNWAAYCGDSGNDRYYELVQEMVGKQVRVFGKYTGISTDLGIPEITFIDKNIFDLPCRLENDDNSFRLFYGDYVYEKPEYDDSCTYGIATFDVSRDFKKEETDTTLFYYYSDDIPAFMMIHTDDLTDPAFDNNTDEELLKIFGNQFLKSSDTEILKKETEINGRKGLLCESTFVSDDCPCPMSSYCYMTIIDRHFYYFGSTQPYLSSETYKEILMDTVNSLRVENPRQVKVSTEGEKKHPSVKEIDGLYAMTVEITGASGVSKTETGQNLYFGEDILNDYDEESGITTVSWDGIVMMLVFDYDDQGNVICHGTLSSNNAIGSIVGMKTN